VLCYCLVRGPVWLGVAWGVPRIGACRGQVGLNTGSVSYGRG